MDLQICKKCSRYLQMTLDRIPQSSQYSFQFNSEYVLSCSDNPFDEMEVVRIDNPREINLINKLFINKTINGVYDLQNFVLNKEVNKNCPYYVEHFMCSNEKKKL